jgi:Phage tail protein (Tail_P2_I)
MIELKTKLEPLFRQELPITSPDDVKKLDSEQQRHTILPINATKLERDLEFTGAAYIGAISEQIRNLWDADTCPSNFSPLWRGRYRWMIGMTNGQKSPSGK